MSLTWPADGSPMVDYALYYASLGIPVFPCGVRAKAPLISKRDGGSGKDDATTDAPSIRGWWKGEPNANIGAAAGFVFDALDVDDEGEESLMEHDPIPPGPEVGCPGGGCHVYFHPSLVPLKNGVRFAKGLDFRTMGGYVLLPPSYVVVKPEPESANEKKRQGYEGRYTWRRPFGPNMPPVPMWIVQAIRRGVEAQSKGEGVPPQQVIEGARNDTLFRHACLLRRFGYSEQEILETLRTLNRVRCSPPLDDTEIATIAGSAARFRPERVPPNVSAETTEPEKEEPRSGPIGCFMSKGKPGGVPTGFDFIDMHTTCQGLADGQLAVVAAYTGGGKTAWALQVAYNITKQGFPVCYITVADMSAEDLSDRLVKNLSGWYGGDEPQRDPALAERWHQARREVESNSLFHVYDVSEISSGRDVYDLRDWVLGQGTRFRAYVIDYAQELCAGNTRNEYERAESASHELRWLARQIKRPILIGSQITEGNVKAGTRDITKGSRAWEERAGLLIKLRVLTDDERLTDKHVDQEYKTVPGLTLATLQKNRFGKKNLTAWWQWVDKYARFEEL